MKNNALGEDYIKRAQARVKALEVLYASESWADVVRESQEIVELTLKGALRLSNVTPPRIHDVSQVLLSEKDSLPPSLVPMLGKIAKISKSMRRDRELAFYGTEDLTPSDFYTEEDAKEAKEEAAWIVEVVKKAFQIKSE